MLKKHKIKFRKQKDSMQCGAACLQMICDFYGLELSSTQLYEECHASKAGVSLLGIYNTAKSLGLDVFCGKTNSVIIQQLDIPCILHWNQNHFVVYLGYEKRTGKYKIVDPAKGFIEFNQTEFESHWASSESNSHKFGVILELKPNKLFSRQSRAMNTDISFKFLWNYISKYKNYFIQIILGLLLGCLLQLIMPFLTQAIVDIGIKHNDIGFVWLVLLGELMIVIGMTATDFIRRWLLLHISMRINISLVSDFFIKLLKLPMSFFDTKLMGDLMQRIGDHARVQNFLTGQVLNVIFTFLSFLTFGIVLFIYDKIIFCVFVAGSIIYALWISSFLRRRKVLDYELFEQQAINQNKTYQFITSMQEIKLQDCEQRRRWEWEDTQADLFKVQMKSLKLQ